MTGLEPHPILPLPPLEFAQLPEKREEVERWLRGRAECMIAEQNDPLNYGFEPEIWHVVDDLLCDGHTVILDTSRLSKLGAQVVTPLEMEGRAELWIAGSNRSSKSEYAGKKIMKILRKLPRARTWSFADTGPISRARQQPIFWRYLPSDIRRLATATGKVRKGAVLNISYSQKGGFTEETFVLPNAAQHWFKNYEQHDSNVEGDQLDGIWLDELRNLELLKTLRGRMGDRGGVIIVTFTSIDENYSAVVNEYERGAMTKLEVPATMLPIRKPKGIESGKQENRKFKDLSGPEKVVSHQPSGEGINRTVGQPGGTREEPEHEAPPPAQNLSAGNSLLHAIGPHTESEKDPEEPGSPAENFESGKQPPTPNGYGAPKENRKEEWEIVGYKPVPRIKIAGPGSDGNQRANIVYFHITDNPYYGYEKALLEYQRTGRLIPYGVQRFYKLYQGATESKIKSRIYGLLEAGGAQQFRKFNDLWHCVDPLDIPRKGTNYLVVDPCDGRNWFMLWIRIIARGWWYAYREWPSHGHPGAYIPGIGDPGPWALPAQAADGARGSGQYPAFGWGLDRYKHEILRLEGHPEENESGKHPPTPKEGPENQMWWRRAVKRPPVLGKHVRGSQPAAAPVVQSVPEEIHERLMDCRYANSPTLTKEGRTTLLEQMDDVGMTFISAPTEGQILGNETGSLHLINDMLDYDEEKERGEYSPVLNRTNDPKLYVSRACPNLIYSLREWTGKDKGHGACKDPIDCLRYAILADLQYVDETAYSWRGGGSY